MGQSDGFFNVAMYLLVGEVASYDPSVLHLWEIDSANLFHSELVD